MYIGARSKVTADGGASPGEDGDASASGGGPDDEGEGQSGGDDEPSVEEAE